MKTKRLIRPMFLVLFIICSLLFVSAMNALADDIEIKPNADEKSFEVLVSGRTYVTPLGRTYDGVKVQIRLRYWKPPEDPGEGVKLTTLRATVRSGAIAGKPRGYYEYVFPYVYGEFEDLRMVGDITISGVDYNGTRYLEAPYVYYNNYRHVYLD